MIGRRSLIYMHLNFLKKTYSCLGIMVSFILVSLLLFSCHKDQEEYFSLWEEICGKIEDDFQRSFSLTSLATIYAKKGEIDKALENIGLIENDLFKDTGFFAIIKQLLEDKNFDLAIELTNQIADNSVRANSLSEISIAYASDGRFDTAITLANSINNLFYRLFALIEIAITEYEHGNNSKALELLDHTHTSLIENETMDNGEREKLLTMIAVRYAMMKRYERAIKIATSLSIFSNKIGCLLGLAEVLEDHRELDKMNDYLEKAFNLVFDEKPSEKIDIDLFLGKIAEIYIKASEYNKALEIAEQIKSNAKRAKIFIEISIIYKREGGDAKAEELAIKAINPEDNEIQGLNKVIVYSTIFNEYIDNGKAEMGIEYLESAVNTTELIDTKDELTKALYLIAKDYVKLEKFIEALGIANRQNVAISEKLAIIALVAEKHIETGIPFSRNENAMIAKIAKKMAN